MTDRNLEFYMEDAEAFAALSEDDKARVFAGDSLSDETEAAAASPAVAVDDGGETSSAAAEGTTTAQNAEPEPVVIAKDGKHTIPFSELESARERARQLEQENETLRAAQAPATADAQAAAEPQVSKLDQLAQIRREARDALLQADYDLADKLEQDADKLNREIVRDEMLADQEKATAGEYMKSVTKMADQIIAEHQILDPKSPNVNQVAIDGVVAERDRLLKSGMPLHEAIDAAVKKVVPMFEKQVANNPDDGGDAAKRAAEVISKAQARVPTSLSQVPAGAAAHHDEGEAIRSRTGMSLLSSFEGKSSEDILKLMSRVI